MCAGLGVGKLCGSLFVQMDWAARCSTKCSDPAVICIFADTVSNKEEGAKKQRQGLISRAA